MERQYTQPELEEALREWLKATIQRLEREGKPREQAEA
jgi:hypothetical protein